MGDSVNYDLRPLWEAILDIYREVARICEKHGVRHQAAFGTALGAVRHGGFIPWDDDFDIMMPRDDYDRFVEIARIELPDHLKVLTYGNVKILPDKTEQMVWRHWCTIRESREEVMQEVGIRSNLAITEGIYIDVFPIDGMPASCLSFFLWRVWRTVLASGEYSLGEDSPAFPTKLWVRKHIFGPLARLRYRNCKSQEDFFWKIEAFCKKMPYRSSQYAGYAYSAIKGELRQPRVLFDASIEVKFENLTIPVPKNYEKYLRLTFGEWRRLPPRDSQKPGHQMIKVQAD